MTLHSFARTAHSNLPHFLCAMAFEETVSNMIVPGIPILAASSPWGLEATLTVAILGMAASGLVLLACPAVRRLSFARVQARFCIIRGMLVRARAIVMASRRQRLALTTSAYEAATVTYDRLMKRDEI